MSHTLENLAERFTEAHFEYELKDDALIVRDSVGGHVEFRVAGPADGANDYRAEVHGVRRVLLINLVTVLAVYKLSAHFVGLQTLTKLPNLAYGTSGIIGGQS